MKLSTFKILALWISVLYSIQMFGQSPAFYKAVFNTDSISGFDEEAHKQIAVSKKYFGEEFQVYMYQQKRLYINGKYKLPFFDYEAQTITNYKFSPSTINTAPCVNEGFESGTFSGWTLSRGINGVINSTLSYDACTNHPCPNSLSTGSLLSLVTTPYSDLFLGQTIPHSPLGGTVVAKLNTNVITSPYGLPVVRISQSFPVTSSNSLYEFAYYAVMDASSPHGCCDQPYMYVKVRDCTGFLLASCPVFSITLPGNSCPGTGPNSWVTSGGKARTNGWQRYSIDVGQIANGCSGNVTIEVTVGHCALGGHYGYAYFDSNCSVVKFNSVTSAGTNTINAPSQSVVTVTAPCASTATLTAPGGLGPYFWQIPTPSGIITSTNQSIVTTAAGDYTCTMTPIGICYPIHRFLQLSFPPPTTINISPTSSICATGSVSTATITASGASQYTWLPSGFQSNFIVVSPTATSVYTLTAKSGTCIGTYTPEITIYPTPTVNVLTSNTSLCPGQTATLQGLGASTYVWYPGAVSGNSIAVSQTATTTYSAVGTSSSGCQSTATTSINMSSSPTVSALYLPFSGTVCAGSTATLIGVGAANFTWMPGSLNGLYQIVSPLVSTTYTGIGANGTCTNQVTMYVPVDPGPTVAVAASPTIICPGETTTISASGSAALGYTWFPGSAAISSLAISPTVTTTYSVFSHNTLGCVSETTVAPIVAPVPSVVLTPPNPSICAGSIITLTASGATGYTWQPGNSGGNTISVSPATSTTYSVLATNGTCTNSSQASLTVYNIPTVSISAPAPSICVGQTLNLLAGGANSFTWLPGNETTAGISPHPTISTVYTVTGESFGCSSTATFEIVVHSNPVLITSSASTTICPGAATSLTASGASSYTWFPDGLTGSTVTVNPTAFTIYTLQGENIYGCTSTKTTSILMHPVPSLTLASSSPTLCLGNSSTLQASGASSYTWLPGAVSSSVFVANPLSSTVYTITGANVFGCTDTKTSSIGVINPPTLSLTTNATSLCASTCATLSAAGATSYSWLPGNSTSAVTAVCPTVTTIYSLTGESLGCSSTETISLQVTNGPTLVASANPAGVCPGFTSTLSASGAVSYTWNTNGQVSSSISVIPASTEIHTVTGESSLGCLSTKTISVLLYPSPPVSITANSFSICAGSQATLTATGADNYNWFPVSLSGSMITVSPSGSASYSVVATSTDNCVVQRTISISVVPLPTLTAASTATAICSGSQAILTAGGATSYTWLPGNIVSSSAAVNPSSTTVYTLTGSLAGCDATNTLTLLVNQGPALLTTSSQTVVCPGMTALLQVSGASSYTWSGGIVNSSLSVNPLITTLYSVTAQNTLGCAATATVQMTVHSDPTVAVSAGSPSICVGQQTTLTAQGAASYVWQPGNLTGSLVVVSPSVTANYTVTGTSSDGCVAQRTIDVTVVPNPVLMSTSNPTAICDGASSTLSVSGASSYTWFPVNLSGGSIVVSPTVTTIYSVTGEASGCTSTETLALQVNNGPQLVASANPQGVCPGFTSTLSASGAVSYTWSSGNQINPSITVSPVATEIHTVTGESAFGCLSTKTISVLLYPAPSSTLAASSLSLCAGSQVTLSATGAASYSWMPVSQSGFTISVSPGGSTTFSVIATSTDNCVVQKTIFIAVVAIPPVTAAVSSTAICVGSQAILTATGASNYTWFPVGIFTSSLAVSPTSTTIYTLTGNTAGCERTETISLSVNPLPTITISSFTTSVCNGSSATFTANGAINYSWSPGSITTSTLQVNPTLTTTYSATGTDINGCSETKQVTLVVNPLPVVTASINTPTLCAGQTATITSSGALTYSLLPGPATGSLVNVSPVTSVIYTVTGNSGFCSSTNTLAVTVYSLPVISVTAAPSQICSGKTTTLLASGANSYAWMPGTIPGNSVAVNPQTSLTYTVTGNDLLGCAGTKTLSVNVLVTPTISLAASTTSLCAGAAVTYSATGASTYAWFPGNLTGGTISISPSSTTQYTVTGGNGTGCTHTLTQAVTVYTLPNVQVVSTQNTLCAGNSVLLDASGAQSYTWSPGPVFTQTINASPAASTIYSLTGKDLNGCINTHSITLTVFSNPTVVPLANPAYLCYGETATLSASGAFTYLWFPPSLSGNTLAVAPANTSNYTVHATDANGCIDSKTITVFVAPAKIFSVSAVMATVCAGSSNTLISSATTTSWSPGLQSGNTITISPLVTTVYTATSIYTIMPGSISCVFTETLSINVNPLPPNLVTSVSGTISCATPSVTLAASSTETNTVYFWNGPASFTSALSSPAGLSNPGIYSVMVTNTLTSCADTKTIEILKDLSQPSIFLANSLTLTCTNPVGTLSTTNNQTAGVYFWSGPAGFTSAVENPTVTAAGNYSLTLGTTSGTCTADTVITVATFTNVAATASITAATCSAGISRNDGKISVLNFDPSTRFDLVSGNTYTGSVSYSNASNVPLSGVITNTLQNPANVRSYTIRLFDDKGCVKDTTLLLPVIDCEFQTLGIAKAVSEPVLNTDGTYNVTYSISVHNYDVSDFKNIRITDSLENCFTAPAAFTVVEAPQQIAGTGLNLNSGFDGKTDVQLTIPATSTLAAGTDFKFRFTITVAPVDYQKTFLNTVTGIANNGESATVVDSSNAGEDHTPAKNIPTPVSFSPKILFGLTKEGSVKKLDHAAFDITYTVTLHNLGNDTLREITAHDSIEKYIPFPARFEVRNVPESPDGLITNKSFNGREKTNLLDGNNLIPPSSSARIIFTVFVPSDTVSVIRNSASGSARYKLLNQEQSLTDVSNDGVNPDTDNNSVCHESQDDRPTVLKLNLTYTLFIPEGFSPDGDNINDVLIIKGLPEAGQNSFTVFNRWGSKVYYNQNYSNTVPWDGSPNVQGNFGQGRLPQGTYYYILEMQESGQKPVTGFIVLQY